MDEAIHAYSVGIALDPADVRCFTNRAAAFMRLRRWEETLRDARAALRLEGDNIKALLRCAEALRNLGRPEEAMEVSLSGA